MDELYQETEEIKWKDLKVGDIIKLFKDEMVPADFILLDTNEIRDKQATCLVDTYLVDG